MIAPIVIALLVIVIGTSWLIWRNSTAALLVIAIRRIIWMNMKEALLVIVSPSGESF
jgi:hypothetical protein